MHYEQYILGAPYRKQKLEVNNGQENAKWETKELGVLMNCWIFHNIDVPATNKWFEQGVR